MMKLAKRIREQQIDRQAYVEYRQDVAQYNLSTLKQIGWIGLTGGTVLVLASLLGLLQLLSGYAAIALLFALVTVLTHTVLSKHETWILPFYYVFITLLLAVGIVMGTWMGRTTNATTFVMLMLTLPLFIIDRPYRVTLLMGVMSAAFCAIDCGVKSGQTLSLDLGNCIVFYLLSIVISHQSIHAKMSDIIIKRELKHQRDVDMLTKLNNRGAFERIVAQYIHQSNKNAFMIILDVDNFKTVNDKMGHAYGDMVLQLVGECLKSAFRSDDIVSRLGGDEFIAFLPIVDNLDIIKTRIEKLLKRISAISINADQPCPVSASIGIAQYPEDGCSFEQLYLQADRALYQAKRNGKGTYVIYDAATMKEN